VKKKTMPIGEPVVTESWNGYQECMKRIQEFLCEVTVRDSEVWLREVCLGSPDRPSIHAPLQIDSAELVHRTLERAQGLMTAVKGSVERTVATSRRVMEDLIGEGADEADAAEILARTDALYHLQAELADATTLAPFEYHPAILVRWCSILRQNFVSGDPSVRVKVTTVYVL
jgi:hypothetical protein